MRERRERELGERERERVCVWESERENRGEREEGFLREREERR